MAKTPNYNHERRERDKAKAAKKAEKLAAKAAAKEDRQRTDQTGAPDGTVTNDNQPS